LLRKIRAGTSPAPTLPFFFAKPDQIDPSFPENSFAFCLLPFAFLFLPILAVTANREGCIFAVWSARWISERDTNLNNSQAVEAEGERKR
jgi:hypothetical protein